MKRIVSALTAAILCVSMNTAIVVQGGDPEEKLPEVIAEALEKNPETLVVSIWYTNIDKSDLYEKWEQKAREYANTLDTSQYSQEEIAQMKKAYYLEHLNAETAERYAAKRVKIAEQLGLAEGSYLYAKYQPVIAGAFTPEQIRAAAALDEVTGIQFGDNDLSPRETDPNESFTVPETVIPTIPETFAGFTEPNTEAILETEAPDPTEPIYGDFNHDGEVNASDAAIMLIYAAAHGAGTFPGTFEEYVNG